jgi:adenylate cyclase
LVEALLQRCSHGDVEDARAATDRLAAVPTDVGFVLHDLVLLRLRALLAHAESDDTTYRDLVNRYGAMAKSLGFEGHIEMAEAMIDSADIPVSRRDGLVAKP